MASAIVWGAGSWGTALALHLASAGRRVGLWVFEREQLEVMAATGGNPDFLPGHPIPRGVTLFNEPAPLPFEADLWLFVVPTQHLRALATQVCPSCPHGALVVSASKGIERDTLSLPSAIIEETLPPQARPVVTLTGPSFAADLAKGDPTTVVLACPDFSRAEIAQRIFSHGHLRGYASQDRLGAELGGAVKNVIALACGIAVGLGFGPNAVAALITRGLREMTRLGEAMGASAQTFSGLSGLGDLTLTCTGGESRNRGVGVRLGRGERLEEILASMKMVAEGVPTTRSVADLARAKGVEMPITMAVERILYEGLSPRRALEELLARGLKQENT